MHSVFWIESKTDHSFIDDYVNLCVMNNLSWANQEWAGEGIKGVSSFCDVRMKKEKEESEVEKWWNYLNLHIYWNS